MKKPPTFGIPLIGRIDLDRCSAYRQVIAAHLTERVYGGYLKLANLVANPERNRSVTLSPLYSVVQTTYMNLAFFSSDDRHVERQRAVMLSGSNKCRYCRGTSNRAAQKSECLIGSWRRLLPQATSIQFGERQSRYTRNSTSAFRTCAHSAAPIVSYQQKYPLLSSHEAPTSI